MRFIGISDCKMQEGSMRCDVNVSLRKPGAKRFGTRTETKNINSLSFIQKAVAAEAERQEEILESGGSIVQQTMHYDEASDSVSPMRVKENSDDYRYFPDPDIIRFRVPEETVNEIRASLPELPFDKLRRYTGELQIQEAVARQLSRYRRVAAFFEEALAEGAAVKNASNLLSGIVFSGMGTEEEKEAFRLKITAGQFAGLVKLLDARKISFQMAQNTLLQMLGNGGSAGDYIQTEDLEGIPDADLEKFCRESIDANPKAVEDVKAGKEKALNVLFGYVMRQTKGKADIKKAESVIRKLLK
jgi:aspartyl-tRNA(Asn)/glutamyl-tRNA(Gln) amidotransferase subunit B